MSYVLWSFDGQPIPQSVGSEGAHDIGGGHITSRPTMTGSGIVHHPLVPLPSGATFDPLGSNLALRSSMDITAKVNLVATGAPLKTALDTWLSRLGKRATMIRQGDDGSQHSATARLVVVDANRAYKNRNFLPVTLTWTLTGLPWSGTSYDLTMVDMIDSDDLPATGADGPTAYPVTLTLVNAGNVNQDAVTITVTAGTSTITAVSLTNSTTGHNPAWAGSLTTGQSLVIDTGARSVQKNGADDYADFTPPSSYEKWFTLAPGANTLSLSITPGGAGESIRFQYTDAWG